MMSEYILVVSLVAFFAFLIFTAVLLVDIANSLSALARMARMRNSAYDRAVESGAITDEHERLPLGLHHPDEESATEYANDKIAMIPAEKWNPYETWDWSSSDEKETG